MSTLQASSATSSTTNKLKFHETFSEYRALLPGQGHVYLDDVRKYKDYVMQQP